MIARVITLLACLAATFPGPLATEVVEYARTVAERQEEARLSGAQQPAGPAEEEQSDRDDSSCTMFGAPPAAPAPVLHTAHDDAAQTDLDEITHPVQPALPLVRTHQIGLTPTRLMRVCLAERALVWSLDLSAWPIKPLAPPAC